MRSGRGLLVRLLLVGGLALVGVAAGVPAASAHAQLVSSTPGEGAVVAQPPATIALEFNEAVTARPDETRVFTGDGAEVDAEVTTADHTVTVTPVRTLPEGTIVVGWAVTSADGHPIDGSVTFAVGEPTPGAAGNEVFEEPTTAGVGLAHHGAVAVAILAAAALVVLLLLGRSDRWLETCWLVALGAAVLAVPLGGVDRDGAGWAGLRDWQHWVDGWLTWRGLMVVVAVAAAACAVTVVRRGARLPTLLAAAVLVLAAPAAIAAPGPEASERPLPGGSPVAQATAGDDTVRVTLDSVRVGTTGFRLELLDEEGAPLAPYAAPRARALHDGLALDLTLTKEGQGVWRGDVTLPSAGEWEVEVSVRLSEFENPVVSLPFTIGDRVSPADSGSH